MNLEVKYGSPQHAFIVQALKDRFTMSKRMMQQRYKKWNEADELFRAYIPEKDVDRVRRQRREGGDPQFTTVYIPYSYAILLTAHTYWSSVFLSRSPVLQYTGRHGETQQQVQALEALMDYQVQVGKMLVPLYIWLLDPGKYGFGVVGNYWADEKTIIAEIEEQPYTVLGIEIPGKTKKIKKRSVLKGYQGNKIYNVRPYDFFPDPRVSLTNLQDGEFCGRLTQASFNSLLKNEDYFNLEELQNTNRARGNTEREMGSPQVRMPFGGDDELVKTLYGGKGFPELLEMTVEVVPREWQLGDSTYPEKWVFTLGNWEVLIGAKPLGADHNQFPFFINSYEIEGYEHSTRGLLEVLKPLNDTMSWLVNTHYYNVRKALNDQLVVDPSRVVMKDLTDGGPGKLIRLSSAAYGQDVRTILSQLPVMDVTQQHFKETDIIGLLMQRVSGVTDNVMGMVNVGGRKTATEIRTSSSFGINRLKTYAEYNSALGWEPLSQVLVQNTQQYYDEEQMFRVAGDLLMGAKTLKVTPEMIAGFYSFVPVDGTLPIDRYAQAQLWKEILIGMKDIPQIAMSYDVAGIFSWMAQLAGLKNITQFKVQVQPNEQLMNAAAGGQMVPMAGAMQPPTEAPAPPMM